MPTLQALLKSHLEQRNLSVKTAADRVGIPYPQLLAAVNKGTVPRQQATRDLLRRELNLDSNGWAAALAASETGIELPAEGPYTLQQLVLREMYGQGYTEQSLATRSGVPYPTVLGITRRSALPRGDTLDKLATCLGIEVDGLKTAAEFSKGVRPGRGVEAARKAVAVTGEGPTLAQLTLDAVTRSGNSAAAFARTHNVPYLSLTKLINHGVAPVRQSVLKPLQAALGLDDEGFQAALVRSKAAPAPASRAKASEIAANPLQAQLLKMIEERGLTQKSFAELVDLSPLTANRLLKKGDLPGRKLTHDKIRALLEMSEEDYQQLLERSRGHFNPVAGGDSETGDEDGEGEGEAPTAAPVHVPYLTTMVPAAEDEVAALAAKLTPAQRAALVDFLRTLT